MAGTPTNVTEGTTLRHTSYFLRKICLEVAKYQALEKATSKEVLSWHSPALLDPNSKTRLGTARENEEEGIRGMVQKSETYYVS